MELLLKLHAKRLFSYKKLCAQFRTQDEPAYCGLTSLVMALNALAVDPGKVWKGPWRWYHESMLDCCTPLEEAQTKGINMDQFVCLARCNGLDATPHRASSVSIDEFRNSVKDSCTNDASFLIASYSRKTLNQTGDGHFSPIAGYHKDRDLVLILDTARFKYPPYWIPLELLMSAMNTIDKESGKVRGYILVSRAQSVPDSMLFSPSCAFAIDAAKGDICNKLEVFVKEWLKWMNSPLPIDFKTEQVIHETIVYLLKLMAQGHIPVTMFCTTLQCSQSDNNSYVHLKCNESDEDVKNVILSAFQSLLEEMSKTQTYSHVETSFKKLSQSEKNLINKLLHCNISHSVEDHKCSMLFENCNSTQPNQNYTTEQTKCTGSLLVLPEHLMTLCLFIWFDATLWNNVSENNLFEELGNSLTYNNHLYNFFKKDLQMTTGEYLSSEVKSLRHKFEETMKYHEFGKLSCCKKKQCCKQN